MLEARCLYELVSRFAKSVIQRCMLSNIAVQDVEFVAVAQYTITVEVVLKTAILMQDDIYVTSAYNTMIIREQVITVF